MNMKNRLYILTATVCVFLSVQWTGADEPARAGPGDAERAAISQEIKSDLVYDPAKVEAAVKILTETKGQTAFDTVQAAVRAFAQVDRRFAGALDLMAEKKFSEAADALYHLIHPGATNAFAAICRYLRAQATAQKGGAANLERAAEQFEELAEKMVGRPSFALLARLEAARLYDALQRFLYAAQNYYEYLQLASKNEGLAAEANLQEAIKRLQELKADVEDPLGAVASRMEAAHQFLSKSETGKPTQTKQDEAVALLDDLIKTAQEQAQQQQQQQQQQQRQQRQSQQQQQQSQSRPQQTPRKATSPAQVSALPPGPGGNPSELPQVHSSDGSDAWGILSQKEREKIIQDLKERFPDRYQEILSEYFIHLGGGRSKP